MATQWGRLMTASRVAARTAIREFRRVYSDPSIAHAGEDWAERRAHYGLLWSLYQSSMFENTAMWEAYRKKYRMYRFVRPLYNPARRLVNFYAGAVYQGEWATTPEEMVQKQSAIPFNDTADPALLAAIAQVFQWSAWQSRRSMMVRYGAALGDVLVEVVDDLTRRKVYLQNWYPGHVANIETNAAGDVTYYMLEYDALDENAHPYTYRREVDKAKYSTFLNDEPFGYDGMPPVYPNPYGFVPAVWILHEETGTAHGNPAIRNINKIDELNQLAAHALDQHHRYMDAPILVSGHINGEDMSGRTKADTNAAMQETLRYLTADADSTIETAKLDPGAALEHMDRLLAEIEADHPELVAYQKLREMSQVSGAAANILLGDTRNLVDAARAQYDQQTVKLCQMAAAIGGWRASSGAWGALTQQQAQFLPFGLESYEAGALNLSIQGRPLVPLTEQDELTLERQRKQLENEQQAAGSNGADRLRQVIARIDRPATQQAPA
jgi:hypothetical protein